MPFPAQQFEHLLGIVFIAWLAQQFITYNDRSVRAKYQAPLKVGGDTFCLRAGQALYITNWIFLCEARFIDSGDRNLKRPANGAQYFGPARTTRGKNEFRLSDS